MNTPNTRRDFLRTVAGVGAGLALTASSRSASTPAPSAGAVGLRAPAMDRVRVGIIGLGARGGGHLGTLLTLDGVEIVALCDNHAPTLAKAFARVEKAKRPVPASYGKDDQDWKRMLERKDLDIVFVVTPWELHAPMGVATMLAGKHVFIEVPIALTVEENWQLVDTAEKTQRHCMMLENTCYGREELLCLNLCRLGVLGELLHAEGAYIHELRSQMNNVEHGTGSWRTPHYAKRNGNLYPTHGIGPVAQYLGINRGDRFDYLSSVSSPARGRELYAKAKFPANHRWNTELTSWVGGDINTSIIKTVRGRSLMMQWDETSPRPYSRLNLIQGTKGTFASYPARLVIEGETKSTHAWTEGATLETLFKKYEHPLWKKIGDLATANGGHGGMDFIMLWRVITCLRQGEPLDQDVYDGTSWSVLIPLTEWSVAHRSQSVDVPDFTRGRWEKTAPLGIVT
jgi:predicted dehydrogenase